MGLTQSEVDPCIFYKKGQILLMCAVFVDDTLVTGFEQEVKKFYAEFQKHYKIEILGRLAKHLGVTWTWDKEDGNTVLKASMPAMEAEIIAMVEEQLGKKLKEQPTPGYPGKILAKHDGEPVDLDAYRSIVGKLLYFMTKVAPELANACRELSSHMANPGPEHWKAIERIAGYLKGRKVKSLTFRAPSRLIPISYCDSNYATDAEDRKSISGMIHTIGGTIVNWSCKKQATVTLSSTEAEYIALSECSKEVKFEWMLLKELTGVEQPAIIHEDNTGAIFLVNNQQVGPRTKHIDVRHHFIRGLIKQGTLKVRFIRSEYNPSDIMTKNAPAVIFGKHSEAILTGTIERWREDVEDSESENGKDSELDMTETAS